MNEARTIGFIGAGNMARAMIGGLIRAGARNADQLIASDSDAAARERLWGDLGVRAVADNEAVAQAAATLVLAVKPQVVDTVLSRLAPSMHPETLVISIAAGVPLERLDAGLGRRMRACKLVRAMPNTPALVGEGITVWCSREPVSDEDAATVGQVFGAVGRHRAVHQEGWLDAVTGLSGSGPAYVFLFLEALSDAGVREGLPRDLADELASQTVLGAARMSLATGLGFAALKNQVTSPGGTTIAGLAELERGAVRSAILEAVHSATKRSRELGR